MKNKKKLPYIIFLVILILCIGIGIAFYTFIGKVLINNKNLQESILSLDLHKSYKLEEIVPFEFDTLYTFPSNTSKEDIEVILGFKSINMKEPKDGMVYLLFVKDEKIVSSICDYSVNLGYKITDFGNRAYSDSKFLVSKENKIIILKGDGGESLVETENNENSQNESLEINDFESNDLDNDEYIDEDLIDDETETEMPKVIKVSPKKENNTENDYEDNQENDDLENNSQDNNNLTNESANIGIIGIDNNIDNNSYENINLDDNNLDNTENSSDGGIIIIGAGDVTENLEVPVGTTLTGEIIYENENNGVLFTYHILDDGSYMCDGVVYKYALSFEGYEDVDDYYRYLVLTNNKNLTQSDAYMNILSKVDIPNSVLVERTLL